MEIIVPLTDTTNLLICEVTKQTHVQVTSNLFSPADSSGVALGIFSPTHFSHNIKCSRQFPVSDVIASETKFNSPMYYRDSN